MGSSNWSKAFVLFHEQVKVMQVAMVNMLEVLLVTNTTITPAKGSRLRLTKCDVVSR